MSNISPKLKTYSYTNNTKTSASCLRISFYSVFSNMDFLPRMLPL